MPNNEWEVARVARDIASECIYTKRVKDNVTVIMVALRRGAPF
jgi:hypothetical protein